jgi:coenzyme F420-0:L-glutamate ligase/coenzyme F420-1:gamma-L-glutamate ligase
MNNRNTKQYIVRSTAVPEIPLIKPGDNLGGIIYNAIIHHSIPLSEGDILVVSSKIISKAEGRVVSLKSIVPSKKAGDIARLSGKDPRIVELMMKESEIINVEHGVIETVHNLGFICTSGGIDRSNTGNPEDEMVSLLPINPNLSAKGIVDEIRRLSGKEIGVVVNDSLGIKYRTGSIGLAIGVFGLPAVLIGGEGEVDIYGKRRNFKISFADEIAATGSLLMGQSDEGFPVVIISGLHYKTKNDKGIGLFESERLKSDIRKLKRDLNI